MKEIVFAGSGGQGVLTAGLILAEIAIAQGMNATWIPSYGSAMRGGTANCTVKYGRGEIFNPAQEEPDILLAMNAPSLSAFLPIVAPGGVVAVNSDLADPGVSSGRSVKTLAVPCVTLAKELALPHGANLIMAGAVVKAAGEFTEAQALKGLAALFARKGKSSRAAANARAFQAGYRYFE